MLMQEIKEVLQDKWDFKDSGKDLEYFEEGFNEELIHKLSEDKKEPQWMLDLRLKALTEFHKRPIPTWCIPDLSQINFNEMTYYIKTKQDRVATNWEEVPEEIKNTFEKIGIPEAERKQLAGAITQYESNAVYANLQQEWIDQGVIFTDLNTALKEHEELVKQYFGKCVPYFDNKFSALHYSVWSGGSFCYVPKGIKLTKMVQNYFRMNAMKEGQFEHTLLIAEEGSQLLYLEGCSSPKYSKNSLHSAVVEIFVKDNAHARYTTVQNWSKNTFNLNTKRSIVGKNAFMEWIGGSLGSKVSMLYPCSILKGEGARADHLNITIAGKDCIKEGGAKVVHAASNTQSKVIAKSISLNGGIGIYRGLVRINPGCKGCKSNVRCDALMTDDISKSDTFPIVEINENDVQFSHEASVGKITEDQLFYLMSRGLSEDEAVNTIVLGFVEPVLKEIPLEYAIELNRLIQLEMTNSIG
ncbi:Uncharacterised protein [uncultured archaeon]|nr:Uncharacterised protein [uncultured archaeon]